VIGRCPDWNKGGTNVLSSVDQQTVVNLALASNSIRIEFE
jgi:hypothetical protein